MAYLTVTEARDFHPPAKNASALQVEITLGLAADAVASLSSLPDEPTAEQIADYGARARRSEALVFAWGWDTGWNRESSYSAGDRSRSFNNDASVQGMVRLTMGSYFTGSVSITSASYLSTFPRG